MSFHRILTVTALAAALLLPGLASAQQVHLLIITPWDFVDELQPLKAWKDETGRPTTIVTLGEIEEIHLGEVRDQPEKIKKYIADFVATHGTQYVMLAGDCDRFPVRYIKALHTHGGSKYYPSDLYYMDLWDANGDFEDWDGNGNWVIGEVDFTGGTDLGKVNVDDIDMVPDVAVARVPASTEAEMATYVNKVIAYESQAHMATWFRNALLVVDGGSGAFGSSAKMDAVVPSLEGSIVTKLYANNAPFATMNLAQRAARINQKVNQGVGLLSYYGHGNRTLWDGWYNAAQIGGLTNSSAKLPIVFATACYTGRFHFNIDYYLTRNGTLYTGGATDRPEPMPIQSAAVDAKDNESMAEHMLVKNATGAVGYVGCAAVVEHGAWLGPNRGLNPYFYAQYQDGVRVLGDLWTGALGSFITDIKNPSTGAMHYYQFIHLHKMILFGDPSLALPRMPRADVRVNGGSGPVTVQAGNTVTISVSLEAGSLGGTQADWWMVRQSPAGWSWFVPGVNIWMPGLFSSIQAPVGDLGPVTVFNQGLGSGTHRFYFGVDTKPNGTVDLPALFFDGVEVTVN